LLPLLKTNRARTRRLAAAHSETRACSLSSSGGEGRGEEALLSISGARPRRCLASAFSCKDKQLAAAFECQTCPKPPPSRRTPNASPLKIRLYFCTDPKGQCKNEFGWGIRVRSGWAPLSGALGFRKRQQAARTPNASRGRPPQHNPTRRRLLELRLETGNYFCTDPTPMAGAENRAPAKE